MDANLVTALAAVVGSCAGASATIVATWIAQRAQAEREEIAMRLRARESLYGKFITEASRLAVDAADHSLDGPGKLVKLYALLGRIRLLAGQTVLTEAEACCRRIVELYSSPNMTMEQVSAAVAEEQFDPLKGFSIACRRELRELAELAKFRLPK
jgi:hypothetical protein